MSANGSVSFCTSALPSSAEENSAGAMEPEYDCWKDLKGGMNGEKENDGAKYKTKRSDLMAVIDAKGIAAKGEV